MQKYAIGVPSSCSVTGMVGLKMGNSFSFAFIQQPETRRVRPGPASALMHRSNNGFGYNPRHDNAICFTLKECLKMGGL